MKNCLFAAFGAVAIAACSGTSDRQAPVAPVDTTHVPAVPPGPSPVLVLSADSIVASAMSGTDPFSQQVQITAGSSAIVENIAVAPPPAGWLTATLSSSTAPATMTVRVDPRSVSAATYSATLPITAAGASPRALIVRFTARPHPVLTLDRATIALDPVAGDSVPSQVVQITSTSDAIGALSLGAIDCPTDLPWLTARLRSDRTPTALDLGIGGSSLSAGAHTCNVRLNSAQSLVDSASRLVAVTLNVHGAPVIALNPTLVLMASLDGGQTTDHATVTNSGGGALTGLRIGGITYGAGGSGWLSASIAPDTAPAQIALTASAASLAAGTYGADVSVESSARGVRNSPQSFHVTYSVPKQPVSPTPPAPSPFQISPAVFTFNVRQNAVVTPQTYTATYTGSDPVRMFALDWDANNLSLWAGITFPTGNLPATGSMTVNSHLPVGSYHTNGIAYLTNHVWTTIDVYLNITP